MKKYAEYQCSTTSLQLVTKLNRNQSMCHTQILPLLVTTLCLQKGPTCKLSVTLSNLNRFSKFLHYWKAYKILYKTNTTLPTSP